MKIENKINGGKRSLKVYEKTFQRANHRLESFPEIRLTGKWLQELGFRKGCIILIEPADKKIVISVPEID